MAFGARRGRSNSVTPRLEYRLAQLVADKKIIREETNRNPPARPSNPPTYDDGWTRDVALPIGIPDEPPPSYEESQLAAGVAVGMQGEGQVPEFEPAIFDYPAFYMSDWIDTIPSPRHHENNPSSPRPGWTWWPNCRRRVHPVMHQSPKRTGRGLLRGLWKWFQKLISCFWK